MIKTNLSNLLYFSPLFLMGCCGLCSCLAAMCSGCGGCKCCKGCGCNGCRTASLCGVRFNRILYLIWFIIPCICTIVFYNRNDLFNVRFWSNFYAFKNLMDGTTIYDLFWIMNIRMVFTYFLYHAMLLAFSLFQLCPATVAVAKVTHRGLLPVKYPFLIIFFFVTFAFPNEAMKNFQYLAYFLGSLFYACITIFILELTYMNYTLVLGSHLAVRIIVMIIFLVVYAFGIVCFVFTYLANKSTGVIVITSILVVLNVVLFIISILAPHTSTFVHSFLLFFQGFHSIYMANVVAIPGFNAGQQVFNTSCYYAFMAFGAIFAFLGIVCFNCVELTLKPLFNGTKDPSMPEFASFISDDEDDDMGSPESTYHYWAFHLVMMSGSCYLSLFTCPPQNTMQQDELWYTVGVASILTALLCAWTYIFPWAAKDRSFK